MEAILIKGGGGGVTSDDVTAKANDVLKGTSTLTSDSNDDVTEGTLELTGDAQAGDVLAGSTFYNTDAHTKQTGTIPRNGEISGSLNCGESKKIPAGYTTGGTIIAIDLASQTGGATAADGNVLTGKTYWKDGVKRTGTMPERGAVSQELAAGGSYTVPEGHHDGAGRVIAKSLASQTGGATATDSTVLDGKTYWKDGAKRTGNIKSLGGRTITPSASAQTVSCSGKYMTGNVTVNAISGLNAAYILKGKVIGGVTGTLAVQSAISFSAAALSYNKIRISWKNPAKGPWQGVFIQMSTSGNPGTGGGSRAYTGSGNNPSQANGSNYVDIGGLAENTTYYYTCTSYCDALGWGSSYNVNTKTKVPTLAPSASSISLTYPMWVPCSAYNSRYGCFGGGRGKGGFNWIDAFNPSLSRTNPVRTSNNITGGYGNENHIVFSVKDGGHNAYNTSLTQSVVSGFQGNMTALPSYILGAVGDSTTVCALSSSLSVTKISRGYPSSFPAITHIGNYAIIAGGYTQYNPDRWTTRITSVNNSLTAQTLSYGKEGSSSGDNICLNNHGMYIISKGSSYYLYCYDKSLTSKVIDISSNNMIRSMYYSTAGGRFAVFLNYTPTVDSSGVVIYATMDDSLIISSKLTYTQSTIKNGHYPGGTQVGDYAMFTGFSQSSINGPALSGSLLFKVQ